MQPSLLPKYRGYGAVSEQFIRGVVYSGVTIYEYNGVIDGGDIIYQQEIKVENYFKKFISKVFEVKKQEYEEKEKTYQLFIR